jgi:hypothetical protein
LGEKQLFPEMQCPMMPSRVGLIAANQKGVGVKLGRPEGIGLIGKFVGLAHDLLRQKKGAGLVEGRRKHAGFGQIHGHGGILLRIKDLTVKGYRFAGPFAVFFLGVAASVVALGLAGAGPRGDSTHTGILHILHESDCAVLWC